MAQGDQGTRPMNFQVPEEMRTMAERSLTQTRQALDSFLGAARRTAETMEQTTEKVQASSKDMAQRTLSLAEQNIRTSLDYAERLVRAKDLQVAAQIQSEFVRSQIEAMQTRTPSFGSAWPRSVSAQTQTGSAPPLAGPWPAPAAPHSPATSGCSAPPRTRSSGPCPWPRPELSRLSAPWSQLCAWRLARSSPGLGGSE